MTDRLHSSVGIITNSSSELYSISRAKLEDVVYAKLQATMESFGSDKSARELFAIEVVLDVHLRDYADEFLDDETFFTDESSTEFMKVLKDAGVSLWAPDKWPAEQKKMLEDWFAAKYPNGPGLSMERPYGEYDYDDQDTSGKYSGTIFIRNLETGQIDTNLSAQALTMLCIVKNGESDC